jgi:hypothetical protein
VSATRVIVPLDFGRFMQNHAQQGIMDFQVSVVFDESQFAKFVHESTSPRPCGADHLSKRLLADFRYDRLGPSLPCQNLPLREAASPDVSRLN